MNLSIGSKYNLPQWKPVVSYPCHWSHLSFCLRDSVPTFWIFRWDMSCYISRLSQHNLGVSNLLSMGLFIMCFFAMFCDCIKFFIFSLFFAADRVPKIAEAWRKHWVPTSRVCLDIKQKKKIEKQDKKKHTNANNW